MRKKVAYLRKSRSDLELENVTGQDTLQRHREIIEKLALQNKVILDEFYEEVVSGETIEARPKIQELLKEIERKQIEEVYVVDVDRLARGDTEDQGRISKTFKYGNARIITPNKIYDPNNESDEDFFEFGLFMSRREYKTINKRLIRGKISSVNEGKFAGSTPPYGYLKEKLKGQKGYKLIINKQEINIIKLIFQMACQNIGASKIANHLNELGIKPRKCELWVPSTIREIIHNPVYYGMIRWNYRKTEKTMLDGMIYTSRPKHNEYILVQGTHEAIVSKKQWELANKNNSNKAGKSSKINLSLQNPLAGIIECGICHRKMQRRPYTSEHIDSIICPLSHCKNSSSYLYLVEERILDSLKIFLKEYKMILRTYQKQSIQIESNTTTIELIQTEIKRIKGQLNKTYDLLEQEIYDNHTFLIRNSILHKKLDELNNKLETYLKLDSKEIQNIYAIPNLNFILTNYNTILSIKEKNELLKSIIKKVIYLKNVKGINHKSEFILKIELNI